jgi:ribosome biogenesis SPOUT family RNA methylase Rps3
MTAGFHLEPRFREVRPEDADAELVVVLGGFMGDLAREDLPRLRRHAPQVRAFRERLAAYLMEQVAARGRGHSM